MSRDKPRNSQLELIVIRIMKEKNPQTVRELISLVKEQLQISDQEIIESILKLHAEGKIGFKKHQISVPLDFARYLKAEQARWYWATVTTAIATAIMVFIIPEDFYPWVYIRYMFGTIFVLWLPGYTFIKALFPSDNYSKASQKSLDVVERVALSLGMSLALVPIVGLLLNYTPWGIRLAPIVLSLLTLTLIFATAALIREYQITFKVHKRTFESESYVK